MITNHWGHLVDSEVPITGVFSNHSWYEDTMYWATDAGIDPDYDPLPLTADTGDQWDEFIDYQQSTSYLGMRLGADGKYEEDPDAEYSAIVRFDSMPITHVIRSVWGIRAALGSPCIPGQGDADTPGDYLCYSLPPECVQEELRSRIFKLEG